MWRTVPPPEGIVARANCSVFGLNWMMVLGFTPDSLYQTRPSGVMAFRRDRTLIRQEKATS
jgi:hypothetical protein